MKIHYQTPFLSLLLLLLTIISPSLSDKQAQDLINQICRTTSDFAFCINILGPGNTGKTDLAGVTKQTISLSLSFAKDTLAFIQQSKVAEKNANVQKAYNVCESNYNRVVGFMEGASNAVRKAEYSIMVGILDSSSRPIIICQDAVADIVPIMRETNKQMRVLLSMGIYEGHMFDMRM